MNNLVVICLKKGTNVYYLNFSQMICLKNEKVRMNARWVHDDVTDVENDGIT